MTFRSHALGMAVALSTASFVGSAVAGDLPDPPVKAPAIANVPFFSVDDNRLTYAYQATATDPGVHGTTAKQVYAFTHFDAWAYGTNFINLSLMKSDHNDPADPCPANGASGCAGATEFYGIIRSTFGFNQIFNTNAFTWGPLRNVSLEVGANGEVENNALSPAQRIGVAGLQFAFDLPYKGFVDIAPMYYKEANHSAFLNTSVVPGGTQVFDGTWIVETNYYMDLGFLPETIPLAISGRAAWTGEKGTGLDVAVPGNLPRKIELNSEPIRLTLDASKMAWGAKYSHFLDLWVAYRYWQNKFGLDHNLAPTCIGVNAGSCTESTVYAGVTAKF
jgi:hypothetical protein